jgi:hypothetical protein
MGKGRLAFILLLSAVIFSGQVLAQSGRKLAPLRKRLPQAVVADSTIGQKPRLRLETIEINRLRVERLPGFSRQQIALQKDVLQTSNPLMNLRFYQSKTIPKAQQFTPSFGSSGHGFLQTRIASEPGLAVTGGISLPHWYGLAASGTYLEQLGQFDNSPLRGATISIGLPQSAAVPLRFGFTAASYVNRSESEGFRLSERSDVEALFSRQWATSEFTHNSSLVASYYGQRDIQARLQQHEYFLRLQHRLAVDLSGEWHLQAELAGGFQAMDIRTESAYSPHAQVQIRANRSISRTLLFSADVSYNYIRNGEQDDKSRLQRFTFDRLLAGAGLAWQTPVGRLHVAYAPRVIYEPVYNEQNAYANTLHIGTRIPVQPELERLKILFESPQHALSWHVGATSARHTHYPDVRMAGDLSYWQYQLDARLLRLYAQAKYKLNPSLLLSVGGKLTQVMTVNNAGELPFTPPWQAELYVHQRWNERWSAEALLHYEGKQFGDSQGQTSYPARFIVGLGIHYSWSDQVRLELAAKNLSTTALWVSPNYRLPDNYVQLQLRYNF